MSKKSSIVKIFVLLSFFGIVNFFGILEYSKIFHKNEKVISPGSNKNSSIVNKFSSITDERLRNIHFSNIKILENENILEFSTFSQMQLKANR